MDWWQTINVLKAYHRQWHKLWVGGMNSRKSWPEWSLHFPTHRQPWQRDKRTKWKCMQTILNKSLSRLRNGTHWNQTLYPQQSRHCECSTHDRSSSSWNTPWPRVDHGKGCKWSRTKFRSRNHKYSALRGMINLYQSTCSKFRYGDGKVLSTQSYPTYGFASTHCVQSINLIKGKVNMYPNSHTHTH